MKNTNVSRLVLYNESNKSATIHGGTFCERPLWSGQLRSENISFSQSLLQDRALQLGVDWFLTEEEERTLRNRISRARVLTLHGLGDQASLVVGATGS